MKSIMDTVKGRCYLCGKECDTHLHHICGGSNRKISDRDGLTVYLCPLCHWRCHNGEQSPFVRYKLHREGQMRWMEVHGAEILREGKDPVEEFRKRYGRSYL